MTIIGRQYEQKQLQSVFQSDAAEFVAVYGRRRVGKTYLIREFFNKKPCIFFRSSGIHQGSLKKQLEKFKKEIENTFYEGRKGVKLHDFSSWHDAFETLKDAIDLFADNQKVVIFLDEIPWMSTPKSGLLEALDYYWNRYWVEDKRIKLIICGSAASWIIDNILHNTGGLHNRVTLRMPLESFTLAETKAYLSYKNIHYRNEQILTLYMSLGGIPFYLNFVEKGLSAIQNINTICFSKKGTLYDEFELLFASLFKKHEIHEEIIRFIASKREGVARHEIESHFSYKGGRLTSRLKELEEAGFIMTFIPWKKERGVYYKVIDEYTLFYLTWIAKRTKNRIAKNIDDHYWEVLSAKPAWKAWAGLAFEAICFKHISQIKKALHIPAGSEVSSWRYISSKDDVESGAQIDLVFDRPDHSVTLCEIKYCSAPFAIDKKYANHLQKREKIYCEVTRTNKQVFHSMIVAGGLKKTLYSEEIIASYATLSDLFQP
ncbi:MAG: ATP-binding protein [Gammaproteobacteria bacterium]